MTVDTLKKDNRVAGDVGEAPKIELTLAAMPVAPNGGYGWVIVLASFFVHMFVLGNIYSFGVFYVEYIEEFDTNRGVIAWAGSIGVGLMGGLGAWSGQLADRYGNNIVIAIGAVLIGIGYFLASFSTALWHLYLTQGIIAGFGYSFAFISGVSIVGQWFTTLRGLAVGIAVAGSGVGQFCMSQITGALIEAHGWRFAIRVLALINFVGLLICALLTKRLLPLVAATKANSSSELFKDPKFVQLYIGVFFNTLGMYMPYTYLPLYAQRYGVSLSQSVLILSLVGLASAVGRIMIGILADTVGKLEMLKLCMFGGGAATLCWMACNNFASILVYGLFFGFFAGGAISLMPTVSAELFGVKKLGAIVGTLFTSSAVGSLLSAPIGGFLYDATGDYYAAISVVGSFLLMGFFVIFTLHSTKRPSSVVGNVIDPSLYDSIGHVDVSVCDEEELMDRNQQEGIEMSRLEDGDISAMKVLMAQEDDEKTEVV